jgi:hypothetical protein
VLFLPGNKVLFPVQETYLIRSYFPFKLAAGSTVSGEKEKSQKLDEGVSRASDWRCRRELLESASPVAFADIRTLVRACGIPIPSQPSRIPESFAQLFHLQLVKGA